MRPDYFIGLDLGQVNDPTALAVVERPMPWGATAGDEPPYFLRHLQRFPLGTPYTRIVPAVARLASRAPLLGRATLVIDQTGVGRPVLNMFQGAMVPARIIPVTITGGNAVKTTEDGSNHVPKKELVFCLQRLLHTGRLKVARTLPEAETLLQELLSFRVKITAAAHETFGAWRQGEHDDLLLAVALACWQAER
ncbi:MAG TPA: hypothetical protein VGZ22_06125 [Isosphaeraceae bacterium]|jgi:hypothetical protein|nr:hypothetical protein [Isosphaeraceae bacterium]